VPVPVRALRALRLLAWAQRLRCHGELLAVVVAALASRRRAGVATAAAALAAHEVGTPLVHAARASGGGAQVAAARRSRAAKELATLAVRALDVIVRALAAARDWILVAVDAIAALAPRGRAGVATALVSSCAREIVSELILATRATSRHADVSAALTRAARELNAKSVRADRACCVAPVPTCLHRQQRALVRALALQALSTHHGNETQEPSCLR